MAAIRGGAQLKTSAPRQAPKKGGGGFLDAIRQGATLKKASDRVLAAPLPKEPNQREDLMSALRSGVSLKKASNRKLKKKEEPEDQSSNIFALMKMRELIQDSDEESEDESGSWDS